MSEYISERKINDPTKVYSFWNFTEDSDDDCDEELDQCGDCE